jgi:BMFP domain-containing protein YqiC
MAAKVSGKFTIDEHTFRFSAIAFGRIGGQNIGAKISNDTEKKLTSLGYDVDEVIMTLQKNLLQGNLTIPDNVTRESFVDD